MNDSRSLAASLSALAIMAVVVVVALPWLSGLSAATGPGPKIDPVFGIPAIPDFPYFAATTNVLTTAMFVIGGVTALVALIASLRRKDPIPVVLTISAIGLVVPEVFVEIMGGCVYPTSPDNISFTIMGRQMSWFIVAGWLGFAAPLLYLSYSLFEKGASDKILWAVYFLAMLASIPTEETLLHFGVYYYYGNQPLVFFAKHPFWWAPCNAGGIFLAAALAYRFKDMLHGWRSLAIMMLTPMAMAGMYAFIALPSWIVVNGNYSWLVTQAGGVLTVLLGIASIAITIRLVVHGEPQGRLR